MDTILFFCLVVSVGLNTYFFFVRWRHDELISRMKKEIDEYVGVIKILQEELDEIDSIRKDTRRHYEANKDNRDYARDMLDSLSE